MSETTRIEYVPLDQLKKAPRNPKAHSDDIKTSIGRFGYVEPIVVDERTGCIVAGHGRREALLALRAKGKAAPVGVKSVDGQWLVPVMMGWSSRDDVEAEAYLLASNKLTEVGGWDESELAKMLGDLSKADALDGVGFSDRELVQFMASVGGGGQTEPDDIPDEPPEAAVYVNPGDIWQLGDHRILCGDSTNADDVHRLLDGNVLTLLHADPPYGMGKEADGIANDNLYGPKLDSFQMRWLAPWLAVSSDVVSIYIWGNAPDLWRLWWSGGLAALPSLMVRNEIVWDKGSAFGMTSADAHSFPPATERCLFLMRGQQFLGNQNIEDYWGGYEPLRSWLESERNRAGWTNGDINRITDSHMSGHWFTKSQFHPITREAYALLAQAAEGRAFVEGYDALFDRLFPGTKAGDNAHRRELSAELREKRSFFDNTHDTMTDVWSFPRVNGADRFGHATPKPVAMVERAIKSSSAPGGNIGAPFGGTGPEIIAAEKNGRRCFAMELEPKYVQICIDRWQAFSGKKAARIAASASPVVQMPAQSDIDINSINF